MKTMFALCALALSCTLTSPAIAAPADKLLGTWELCNDPDGDPKDVIAFRPDGSGTVTNPDGRAYALTYTTNGANVLTVINIMSRRIEIRLTLSNDGKQLLKPNPESGTSSTYVRLGNPDKARCTAR